MKHTLIHFLKQYGNDFFHKLPRYKTAKCGGKYGVYVNLIKFNPETLTFTVVDDKGTTFTEIDLFKLDEFVL